MNLTDRLFSKIITKQVNQQVNLAIAALDDTRDRLLSRDTYPRDRHSYDRDTVLADALEAWRVNPLARRIVELNSQYVVGGGIQVECKNKRTHEFIQDWWNHPLNRMNTRCIEFCDELTRSGDLFLAISTDPAGMSFVRAIPAADIIEIETAENDLEQELWFYERPFYDMSAGSNQVTPLGLVYGRKWRGVSQEANGRSRERSERVGTGGESIKPDPNQEADGRSRERSERVGTEEGGSQTRPYEPVMMHFAVNKPVGAKFGEFDLAPLLRWLARYSNWLEDRARLNRYRNTFLFQVKAAYQNEADRLRRQAELNMNPPEPGSMLVTDITEEWSVLSPQLESHEAGEDGLALKKMIASGSGTPLHFLAEPEGSNRTTAESAGGPTFRHYEQRQLQFLNMIESLVRVVLWRRRAFDRLINLDAELNVKGSDISARDNASMSVASSTVIGAFSLLRDRGLIDDTEFLRIAYRFAGEVTDIEEMLKRGEKAPPPKVPNQMPVPGGVPDKGDPRAVKPNYPGRPSGRPGSIEIDPITGDVKGSDRA